MGASAEKVELRMVGGRRSLTPVPWDRKEEAKDECRCIHICRIMSLIQVQSVSLNITYGTRSKKEQLARNSHKALSASGNQGRNMSKDNRNESKGYNTSLKRTHWLNLG